MSHNRVLSLSLRPNKLEDLYGQDDIVKSLKRQFKSKRVPHFYILSGSVGTGKTTIARILAYEIHKFMNKNGDIVLSKKSQNTTEVNAANQTGIDDVRKIIDNMTFKPMPPCKAKIVILDEAHQLSLPAQNALITATEDVHDHVFYIFCTSNISKIIPALRRRAFIINPKPFQENHTTQLVKTAANYANFQGDLEDILMGINSYEITSPGIILQAVEKYFSGMPVIECVSQQNEHSQNIDSLEICRAVVSGSWSKCSKQLKNITKADAQQIRISVLGYLKTIILNSTGNKAATCAKAIRYLNGPEFNDELGIVSSTISSLCLICAQFECTK